MQHKILNNDYENVLKFFKMNIHATFICLHLKLMGMKTTTCINVYHYANSEASRELENKKLNRCLSWFMYVIFL